MADTEFAFAYDNLELTLGEAIDDTVTTFDLASGDGSKLDAAKLPIIVSVGNPTTPSQFEFILIEAFTGDTVDTATRGYLSAGLGATAWPIAQQGRMTRVPPNAM